MQSQQEQIQQIVDRHGQKQHLDLAFQINLWSYVLLRIQTSNIEILCLADCQVANDNISYLFSKKWKALKQLNLSNNLLEKNCFLKMMTLKKKFRNLTKLSLNCNQIGNKGMIYLKNCYLPHLKILEIKNNQINSQGMKQLQKGIWPQLTELYFQNQRQNNQNKVNLHGWDVVGKLPNLHRFYFQQNELISWLSCSLLRISGQIVFLSTGNKQIKRSIRQILDSISSHELIQQLGLQSPRENNSSNSSSSTD